VLSFSICNDNGTIDDNFDVYFNNHLVGSVVFSANSVTNYIFVADNTSPSISFSGIPYTCSGTTNIIRFSEDKVRDGQNLIKLYNVKNNNNGNSGIVEVKQFSLTGSTLVEPTTIDNFTFSGDSNQDYNFYFNYGHIIPGITPTPVPTPSPTPTCDAPPPPPDGYGSPPEIPSGAPAPPAKPCPAMPVPPTPVIPATPFDAPPPLAPLAPLCSAGVALVPRLPPPPPPFAVIVSKEEF
jgi:hypothetical protein